MNEKDILKALECCAMPHTEVKCYCCKSTNVDICSKLNPTIILALIKRQQAEIEKLTTQNIKLKKCFTIEFDDDRLKKIVKKTVDRITIDIKQAENEAIREFADKLRERMFGYYECLDESAKGRPYKGDTLMDYEIVGMIEDCIDNLVEAMTGGENNA